MHMKKIFLLCLTAIVLVLAGCSASNTYTYILDDSFDGFIIMGTSAEYPPYEWPMKVDGKQEIVGIDIELAKHIARRLNKNLKVINKGFDFLLEDLSSGRVDFVIAGMTPTDERALVVDFSDVYYEALQAILIKSSDLEVFSSFDDLNKNTVRIGAQLGSIQQDLAETFTNAHKQYIQTVPDLVMRLSDGQLHAVVMEKPVADGYVANQSGLAIAPIAIGDPDGGSAVAVKKGDKALLDVVNEVIQELIESGQMDQIVNDMILLNS